LLFYEDIDHKIYTGNSLQILKKLESNSIDCIITSPPYFNLRDYKTNSKKEIGKEKEINIYIAKLVEVFLECKRILKNTGNIFINIDDTGFNLIPEKLAITLSNFLLLQNKVIWVKPNAMPSPVPGKLQHSWEYVYHFTKSNNYKFNKIKTTKKLGNNTKFSRSDKIILIQKLENKNEKIVSIVKFKKNDYEIKKVGILVDFKEEDNKKFVIVKNRGKIKEIEYTKRITRNKYNKKFKVENLLKYYLDNNVEKNINDVFEINLVANKSVHVAPFPETLIERLILIGTNENDIVLDPFAGSGTVAYVSKKLNRKSISIELNKNYCQIIKDRLLNNH
jgi:site-specific DNA-methyltransferase (adenine-specific)